MLLNFFAALTSLLFRESGRSSGGSSGGGNYNRIGHDDDGIDRYAQIMTTMIVKNLGHYVKEHRDTLEYYAGHYCAAGLGVIIDLEDDYRREGDEFLQGCAAMITQGLMEEIEDCVGKRKLKKMGDRVFAIALVGCRRFAEEEL